jgi:hypothetical protein
MMLSPAMVDKFLPYLDRNPEKNELLIHKKGLVPDAPPEAVAQYIEFQRIMENAEKRGDEI